MPTQSKKPLISPQLIKIIITALFHFLVLTVPFYFSFKTSELFEFNKMLLVYAATIIIFSSWLLKMALEKKLSFKRTYLDIPILLFLVSQMMSTFFSIHPYTSLFGYYSRFHGGLLSTLSYILLYYSAVNTLSKKDIQKLTLSLFASGALVSVYAILEHFGHSFSCYLSSEGQTFDANCWVQDVQNRVFATFGQPNWLAAYAIMLLPLGLYNFVTKKSSSYKAFYFISTILLWLALIFTKSRSGLLGFIVSIGVLTPIFWIYSTKEVIKKTVTPIFLMIIFLAGIFGTPFTPTFSSLVTHTQQPEHKPVPQTVNRLDVGGTDSGEIRKIVWQGAFEVWKRYPIIGSGLETFAYSYYLDRPMDHNHVSEWDFLYNKAHNEFLNIAATTGTVGLLTYILMLGTFVIQIITKIISSKKKNNLPKSEANEVLFLTALLASTAALSVSNFFGFSTVVVSSLLFLFFSFSAVIIEAKKERVIEFPLSSLIQNILFVIAGIFFIFQMNRLFSYRKADETYTAGKVLYSAGQYIPAFEHLHKAINLSPGQAEFYSELATKYAELAVQVAPTDSTASAELIPQAITFSDAALTLNPVHLNFYKDRSRVFILLSQLDPTYLQQAKTTLIEARKLSPTDPKLVYHLALIEHDLENKDESLALLEQAVTMKPNYEQARFELAEQYEEQGKIEKAIEQHQYILDHIAENQLSIEKIEQLQSKVPSNQ